jgi:hypothetical protein
VRLYGSCGVLLMLLGGLLLPVAATGLGTVLMDAAPVFAVAASLAAWAPSGRRLLAGAVGALVGAACAVMPIMVFSLVADSMATLETEVLIRIPAPILATSLLVHILLGRSRRSGALPDWLWAAVGLILVALGWICAGRPADSYWFWFALALLWQAPAAAALLTPLTPRILGASGGWDA